jgi:hypothetical protein
MIEEKQTFTQEVSKNNLEQSINLYKQRWKNKIKQIDPKVLNRRKRKLDELLSSNDPYFSEDSIMQRDPILYEIYVGAHKRNCEIFSNQNLNVINSGSSLSNFLIDELASEIHRNNLNHEFEKEINQYGEEEIRESYVK